jgi:hypothetical protein
MIIGDRVKTSGTESALFPRKKPLTIQIQEYEACSLDDPTAKPDWSKGTEIASYAINPNTLPTASELDEWGRNLLGEYSQLPDFQPYIMDQFLFAYFKATPDLPFVSLFCHLNLNWQAI